LKKTRDRILRAASEIFAEQGFRRTTVRQICMKAGANLASVNYHFRSKAGLYRAVWERASEQADILYPIDGGVPPKASAEERLRGNISALIKRMTDRERLGYFHQIRMMELTNPTGLLDEALSRSLQKKRKYTLGILRDLLGPGAADEVLELCHMSIISQCLMAKATRKKRNSRFRRHWQFTRVKVDRLTDHIIEFCLAGIREVRKTL